MTNKKRIEAIVNSLHEPIIGLDPDKKILFMNNEAFTILNLKPIDVIGKNAAEVALGNDLLRRLIRGLYSSEKDDEPLKIYADNKESYFQMENIPLYISPIGEKEQNFIGNVIILNNITKYKELDSAKTNFISTVSHEMKTPISSILMSLQLLEDSRLGALNDEQKALSQSIRESSDRLLKITGELLNMTQLETGKLQLMPKVTKPIELIEYAVGATRVLAERFGCFVEVEYPEDFETVRRQRKNRMGHHEPAQQRDPPFARRIAHHRRRCGTRQNGGHLRAGLRPGHRPALPQEYLRPLLPRARHEGTGQRAGPRDLERVRRSARRYDRH